LFGLSVVVFLGLSAVVRGVKVQEVSDEEEDDSIEDQDKI